MSTKALWRRQKDNGIHILSQLGAELYEIFHWQKKVDETWYYEICNQLSHSEKYSLFMTPKCFEDYVFIEGVED